MKLLLGWQKKQVGKMSMDDRIEAAYREGWTDRHNSSVNTVLGHIEPDWQQSKAYESLQDDELILPPTPTDDDPAQLVAKYGILKLLLSGRNLNLFPIPQYKDSEDLPTFGIQPGGL